MGTILPVKAQRRIHVVGGGRGYVNWMQGTEIVPRMEDADLVVLTGGEDVSSFLYREPPHPTTYSSAQRDEQEMKAIQKACALGKPLWGTCRGGQILTVAAGGRLVQDQSNPRFIHPMTTFDGETLAVSSTHHQAFHPWNLNEGSDFHVLGWTVGLCGTHQGGHGEEMVTGVVPGGRELEVVYYPHLNALSCQPHPEMVYGNPQCAPFIAWSRGILNGLLDGTLLSRIQAASTATPREPRLGVAEQPVSGRAVSVT